MEELILRHKAMLQALLTLEEGLQEIEISIPNRPKAYKLMRDGVTQRFEYCIDLFWKFLKIYLGTIENTSIELPSPSKILRLSFKLNLITNAELDVLLDCITERNLTSHTYDEKTAEEIQRHIPLYHLTMKIIVNRLKIKKNNN